jgi:hypothetical protein
LEEARSLTTQTISVDIDATAEKGFDIENWTWRNIEVVNNEGTSK